MEASTDAPISTGSRTIADLMARSAEVHGDAVLVRHKRDGVWHEQTFAEVGTMVSEAGRGLIDLGLQAGERVCLLANTRPEWTVADLAISSAGCVVVPIYPTNAPEECEWVAGNSGARAVVCEDAAQVAKINAVRDRLPELAHIIVIDPAGDVGDALSLDDLRERGRGRDTAELSARSDAVTLEDPFTFIYTSGTTGPPKGCVLTHSNYRDVLDMAHRADVTRGRETAYLFLPLAHAYALLIQLLSFDGGGTLAYWGGDPQQIVAELSEVRPSYFPSVPRIFEKIYTLATAAVQKAGPEEQQRFRAAVDLGVRVRDLQVRGEPIPQELQAPFAEAEERLYKNVRAIFGGNIRQAVSGAAPIAREILEFFYACGVPVLEGYGMTETATVATYSTPEHHRFGSVGRALPGCEVRIADDGEILIKGANIFRGYYKNDDASFGAVLDGWLHTGDLGRIDADGLLYIVDRAKDMINRGGENVYSIEVESALAGAPGIGCR